MNVKDFDFYLPEELIAQDPLEKRDNSKLLVLNKETGEMKHTIFHHIIDVLEEGDCLVVNNTKVIPARLFGNKVGTDAKIEDGQQALERFAAHCPQSTFAWHRTC